MHFLLHVACVAFFCAHFAAGDAKIADSVSVDSAETSIALTSCKMPLVVRLNAHVKIGDPVRHAAYPKRVVLTTALRGAGIVEATEWPSNFLIISALDRTLNMPVKASGFSVGMPSLFRETGTKTGSVLYRLSYDTTAASKTASSVEEANVIFTLFVNTTILSTYPAEARQILLPGSHVTLTWSDDSVTTVPVEASGVEINKKFVDLGCAPASRSAFDARHAVNQYGNISWIQVPLSGFPSPAPTVSPTLVPGLLPTRAPTEQPTPVPTPLLNGDFDADIGGCSEQPWTGPWIGDSLSSVFSNYVDSVVNTKITVAAASGPCIGCANAFYGDYCRKSCLRGQGTHYSVPFEITIENYDKLVTLPRGDDGTMPDGVIVVVNVSNINVAGHPLADDPLSMCTSIYGDESLVVITPPEVDARFTYKPDRRPGFSAHRVINATHAFIVFRVPILPKMPFNSSDPTRIVFTLRVEGCGPLNPANATLQQFLRVEARLVTGPCDELVYRWLRCKKNPYPVPSTTKQYIYDYRQCVDGYFSQFSVSQTGNSPYGPLCAQCPQTPPPTFPLSVRAAAKSVHHPRLEKFTALDYNESGLLVEVVPYIIQLSPAGINECGISTTGLQQQIASRFLCSVEKTDIKENRATEDVSLCADAQHKLAVLRFDIQISNLVGNGSIGAISGELEVSLERKEYEPEARKPCEQFYALYSFETFTSGASFDVLDIERHGTDRTVGKFSYTEIPPANGVHVIVYALTCTSRDYSTLFTLEVNAKDVEGAAGSNGISKKSSRRHARYVANVTNPAGYPTFECNALQLEDSRCQGADVSPRTGKQKERCPFEPSVPCAYPCDVKLKKMSVPSIVILISTCACWACCFGCCYYCYKDRKKKKANAASSSPLVSGKSPFEFSAAPTNFQPRARKRRQTTGASSRLSESASFSDALFLEEDSE
jgi:hypothetical protein